jgi:serine phosphatase RsbU (regulator of sigma subunit)
LGFYGCSIIQKELLAINESAMMTESNPLSRDCEMTNQELVEREAELALINSVQQALASRLDVQAIYNLVGDKIRDIFDSQVVMISTYDAKTETIEHRYAIERGEHIFAPGRYPIRGFRTQIVQTRQPVLVNTNVAELARRLGQHTIPGTITPKSWLGVPMIVGDQVTGILSLQNVDRENAFDHSDVRLLQTLAASMSVALENARLFDETQRLLNETELRATELQIINSVQEELARKLDIASIYELVGEKLEEYFQPADLSIVVYEPESDLLSAPFQVENGERNTPPPYNVGGKGFMGFLLQNPQPLLIAENMQEAAIHYQNVYSSDKGLPMTVLYVPIMMGDTLHGVIVLKDMEREHAFDATDIRLLKTLANAMSVAIENARLWEQEALYRKALEREFEIGREIQAGFLPETLVQPQGWEIAAAMKSAREVTGDFYDVFELTDGKIGLVIADVCDKGLGAALFMTLFRSLIRAVSNIDFFTNAEYAGPIDPGSRIENAMSLTNNYIAETHGDTNMFCTIFFGILDTTSGMLTYINAGHLPPIVINQQGVIEKLTLTGPAVGLTVGTKYGVGEVRLEPGEVLFAYTDGLTDTVNPEGEYFDIEELIPLFVGDNCLSAELDQVQGRLKEYSSGTTQIDDITLLVVRRKED